MSQTPEANSQQTLKQEVWIRAANPSDLPAILALEQSTPSAAHWSLDHYQSRIQSQPQAACFLVAERRTDQKRHQNEAQVCGFLGARIVAGEWEIENVVVDREVRRQGVGTLLMQALIKKWQGGAGTALLLEVRESNTAARALYERHGLREVGRRSAYYRGPAESAILYSLHRD
jgi:ribosomal-protein-alanine acetyltransferase